MQFLLFHKKNSPWDRTIHQGNIQKRTRTRRINERTQREMKEAKLMEPVWQSFIWRAMSNSLDALIKTSADLWFLSSQEAQYTYHIMQYHINWKASPLLSLFSLNLLNKLRNRNLVICYRKKIRRLIDPICLTNYHSTVAKNDVELVVFELFRFARRSYKYTFAAQL